MIENKLKIARIVYGNLTQAEVAEKVGCSRQTINSIENNKFIPSVELALRIAQLLDARVEDIFYLPDMEKQAASRISSRSHFPQNK